MPNTTLTPLLVNAADNRGGAGRGAFTLHRALRRIGVNSRMLVRRTTGNDPHLFVSPLGSGQLLRDMIHGLSASERQLLLRGRSVTGPHWSTNWLPNFLTRDIRRLDPDIVHLNWVGGGFLPISALSHFRRPIVWTLRDSWAFTGGCHVPFDCLRYRVACGACPQLHSRREHDLSRLTWQFKARSWRNTEITIVALSRWLAECARSSSLFHNQRIEVIPNGIDLERFRPIDQTTARSLLNLPPDKKIILFGAIAAVKDPNKGFDLLQAALKSFSDDWRANTQLVVFGSHEPANPPDLDMTVSYLGQLNDDLTLAILYSAADVTVVPSRQEAFGKTAAEAMACGTPVVAFGATGLLDIVDHRTNGYLAQAYQSDDLAHGIEWVLEDDARRKELGNRAREKVEREFDILAVAERYKRLYEELIQSNPNRPADRTMTGRRSEPSCSTTDAR